MTDKYVTVVDELAAAVGAGTTSETFTEGGAGSVVLAPDLDVEFRSFSP